MILYNKQYYFLVMNSPIFSHIGSPRGIERPSGLDRTPGEPSLATIASPWNGSHGETPTAGGFQRHSEHQADDH